MYILGKRADLLTSEDIQRLLDNMIQENKSLDYKKELHISKDADKKEFLFDISAMYNTDGGCIVFGIEEQKDSQNNNTGKPLQITGIEISNSDKLIQQIEDIVKNCTEPSINHLLIKEILIEDNKILVIGIPKALGLPSMVTFNQAIAGVKPNDKINLTFILHSINSIKPDLLNLRRGVRQKNLSLEKIKNIPIYLPPLKTQQTIVQKLDALYAETKKLESIYQQKINDLEELKKSILQKAFSGELKTVRAEV